MNFTPFSQMSYAQYRQLVAVHQDGGFLVRKRLGADGQAGLRRLVFITSLASMAGLAHYASARRRSAASCAAWEKRARLMAFEPMR